VLYRRKCLEQCKQHDGYVFNPIFRSYGGEDVDLAFRVRLKGHKLVYIDNNIKHLKAMTPLKYLSHQFKRGLGIGILYEEHKKKKHDVAPDKSLLWNNNKVRFAASKWLVMVWKKVLGPFDRNSFSSKKHFWAFWMGVKFQAIWFLYAVIYK